MPTRLTAALMAGLAVGAPAASGAPRSTPAPSQEASPGAGATIVRVDDRSGFDWADAGIGAAGGIALCVLGAGAVLLASERRARGSRPIDISEPSERRTQ